MRDERRHSAAIRLEHMDDLGGRAVAQADPDDLWWEATKDAEPVEVLVFGDEHEAMRCGVLPHERI